MPIKYRQHFPTTEPFSRRNPKHYKLFSYECRKPMRVFRKFILIDLATTCKTIYASFITHSRLQSEKLLACSTTIGRQITPPFSQEFFSPLLIVRRQTELRLRTICAAEPIIALQYGFGACENVPSSRYR